MTQPYAVLDPRAFGRYQRGTILDLEAMRGEPLERRGTVLKVSAKEAARAERVPGALPCFADAELNKILVDRGLVEAPGAGKVSKTSFIKR